MHLTPRIATPIALIIALVAACLSSASPLSQGDTFPEFEAEDQHGKAYPMPQDTKYVAVTFAMGSGKKANAFFSEQGAEYLPGKKAVFLSNIYGMPSVARYFAIPKMQKYPHRIMLADQKGLLDDFPQEKGKVTVFTLDANRAIVSVKFWDPANEEAPF